MIAVRNQVRRHPETHDQGTWGKRTGCRTTLCLAGWAAVLGGADPVWDRHTGRTFRMLDAVAADGQLWSVEDYAQDALGLTSAERERLFYEMDKGKALAYLDELISSRAANSVGTQMCA